MRALILLLLVTATLKANAVNLRPGDSLISRVVISKVATQDRYVFSICSAVRCERVGSEAGYTGEQIEKLGGRLEMVSSTALGIGEGAVTLYLSGTGIAIGAGYESGALLLGLGTGGLVVPPVAIHFIRSINPVQKFKDGHMKSEMESAVEEMIEKGEASVVLQQSADLQSSINFAKRLKLILAKLN